MRSEFKRIGAVAICIAASSTVSAETILSVKETRQIAYKYGKCLVSHHAGSASEAVLRNVDNETLRSQYSILIHGDCLAPGAKLSFPGDFYRYALADALVARELGTKPVPDISKVPPLEHALTPIQPMPPLNNNAVAKFMYSVELRRTQQAEMLRALSIYGECVVRVSPSDAKALLLTEPETPSESGRFQALQPALAQCMPEGKTMTLDKFVLRGIVAVNYYRLAKAAPSSTG